MLAISTKGMKVTKTVSEKYGEQESIILGVNLPKYQIGNVMKDGVPCTAAIVPFKNDSGVWELRMHFTKIEGVKEPTEAKTFNTATAKKTPAKADDAELQEYKDFLAFKAMKASAVAG